jgi:hypothetical protein
MKTQQKIEREWWFGLRWPKLHGKTQQLAESRLSTIRGVDRRGTAGMERGGGRGTIVWGDDWNDKKIERKWGHGLKWPKLHGKTQQPAESRHSRLGVLIEEARLGWSVGGGIVPSFGATIGTTKK